MIQFTDGPAAGVTLTLGRAPVLLRVTRGASGWDALDQLEDTPTEDEEVWVYRIEGQPGTMHVDSRDPKTGRRVGRWMIHATYKYHCEQPDDATVRDNEAWARWTYEQQEKGNL